MRVSQLLHAMDKDEIIYISDYDLPIDRMTLYSGTVRGIERENPINKMHIISICADKDEIHVLAQTKRRKAMCSDG